jgi:hypothetical protein
MNYVPKVTRRDVLRILERDFRPGERGEAMTLLRDFDDAMAARLIGIDSRTFPNVRVHLAILKLSDGDIRRVREHIEAAKSDFRDVIFPAECPESCAISFVDVARLRPAEREALKLRDWQQYERWFTRR